MNFSASNIVAGLVFGVFGFYAFRKGKLEANGKRMALGVALMGYGYFTHSAWATWGVGLALVYLNHFTRLVD